MNPPGPIRAFKAGYCDTSYQGVTVKAALLLVVAVVLLVSPNSGAAPVYSAWSAPVNLGPAVNSAAIDGGPAISKHGLSLFFGSTRPGGVGPDDHWVPQRARVTHPR